MSRIDELEKAISSHSSGDWIVLTELSFTSIANTLRSVVDVVRAVGVLRRTDPCKSMEHDNAVQALFDAHRKFEEG